MFEKMLYSAIATTGRCFEDEIALKPQNYTIPDPDMILEQSGDISNDLPHNPTVEHQIYDDAEPIEGLLEVPQIIGDGQPLHPHPQQTWCAP